MTKLGSVKMSIIRQKENEMHNQKIAYSMKVSARWIKKQYSSTIPLETSGVKDWHQSNQGRN